MPFHFPLQAVLHFRQSIEHQQELRLRAAHQQVARVRHLIEQLNGRRQEMHGVQEGRLQAGMTAAEIQFELLCETELLRHRQQLWQQAVRLEQQCEQQREIFHQARRARQTLEAVRERQIELYQKEAARRQQRNLDNLFLLRRQYLRRG
jgi:flagellar export protein FliJ